MNSETAILAAIVLALLVIVGAYGMMSTVVDEGGTGIKNLSNRTHSPIGKINFTSYQTQRSQPGVKVFSI